MRLWNTLTLGLLPDELETGSRREVEKALEVRVADPDDDETRNAAWKSSADLPK